MFSFILLVNKIKAQILYTVKNRKIRQNKKKFPNETKHKMKIKFKQLKEQRLGSLTLKIKIYMIN